MAQVLKDEVRNKILQAASVEIIQHGIDGLQMRKIAEGADVTVGNLYRYYADKESLIHAIIEPALNEINDLLQLISDQQLSLLQTSSEIDFNKIYENLEVCSKGLVDIFYRHTSAMLLLSNEYELSHLTDWFKSILFNILKINEPDLNSRELEFLSSLVAISIIKGMQEGFKIALQSPEASKNLDKVILKYLQIVLRK
ncbi:TetR/AcrR family transcriptional regulator [Anaerorhabdus sp.]|uniref:TetR/AcrR family transcriptional regulator n=1 Tax=Anaerorhabdus sp. TaxID=1872524 RepID=UPI002B1F07F2|nr:TetR/AcrR family transcriptional regulator [Anaerorhabdus sp.]MEA4874085.1 TetR/AcrR family transcriptional regulator [Anaerorhabdus sp.]